MLDLIDTSLSRGILAQYSVDLTATPALLSIGGKTYTTDQIKRVIRPATSTT